MALFIDSVMNNFQERRMLQETNYFKCLSCNYEFLSKSELPSCPRCKWNKLERMDLKKLVGFDG